jgi:hypothetical protein
MLGLSHRKLDRDRERRWHQAQVLAEGVSPQLRPPKQPNLTSFDGQPDRIRCGPGKDAVWADFSDTVARGCELVKRRSP